MGSNRFEKLDIGLGYIQADKILGLLDKAKQFESNSLLQGELEDSIHFAIY
jgi:hypothetical protein